MIRSTRRTGKVCAGSSVPTWTSSYPTVAAIALALLLRLGGAPGDQRGVRGQHRLAVYCGHIAARGEQVVAAGRSDVLHGNDDSEPVPGSHRSGVDEPLLAVHHPA